MNEKENFIVLENVHYDLKTNPKTRRTQKREQEDENFLPVIIKRVDNTKKHPDDILNKAISEGLEQHKRSKLSLLISSMAAGLILGFTAMCVCLASQLLTGEMANNIILNRLLLAIFYPLGFMICIISGTQLFTEHTALAVYPVLDQRTNLYSLIKLLCIVLIGNFIGTFLSSLLLTFSDSIIMAKDGALTILHHLLGQTTGSLFISAILAGWLMAQGGWLVLACSTTLGQLFSIYLVTFIIGFGGLHHSIAGSAELFLGLLNTTEVIPLASSAHFLIITVLGNLFGGSLFVAFLNYAHIKKTQSST